MATTNVLQPGQSQQLTLQSLGPIASIFAGDTLQVTFTTGDGHSASASFQVAAAPALQPATYSPAGTPIYAPQYGTGTQSSPIDLSALIQAAQSGNTAAQAELGALYRDGTISTGGAPLPPYAAFVGLVAGSVPKRKTLVQAPNGTWIAV
jgi:TPR repeat protein